MSPSTNTEQAFTVTGTTPDGQSDTLTVTATDEWKARSKFMAFTSLRPQGQTVSYDVVAGREADAVGAVESVEVRGKRLRIKRLGVWGAWFIAPTAADAQAMADELTGVKS